MTKRKADAIPGGGGGKGPKNLHRAMSEKMAKKRNGTVAIGARDWVADKIADGDLDGGMPAGQSGTSIFDPVLCELAYRWFCPPGGMVLDPFAGGSVRGVVASRLGRGYVGIELRAEQVEANHAQLAIAGTPHPEWRVGDSRHIAKLAGDVKADLVFSCPPYWNLEVYSEDPNDLSTLGKEEFFAAQAVRQRLGHLDARAGPGMATGAPPCGPGRPRADRRRGGRRQHPRRPGAVFEGDQGGRAVPQRPAL